MAQPTEPQGERELISIEERISNARAAGEEYAVRQYIDSLINDTKSPEYKTLKETLAGVNSFFSLHFNRDRFPYDDTNLTTVKNFVTAVVLSTPGLENEDSPAIILDEGVQTLLSEVNDVSRVTDLIELTQIANGEIAPLVSREFAILLRDYMRARNSKRSPDALSLIQVEAQFRKALNDEFHAAKSIPKARILDTLGEMASAYPNAFIDA
jgi:hypothetical protein